MPFDVDSSHSSGRRMKTRYRPGGGETISARRWQLHGGISFRRKPWIQEIAADLQSAHIWWPAVAKLQAASVPIAQAGSCAMGQTDGRTDIGIA